MRIQKAFLVKFVLVSLHQYTQVASFPQWPSSGIAQDENQENSHSFELTPNVQSKRVFKNEVSPNYLLSDQQNEDIETKVENQYRISVLQPREAVFREESMASYLNSRGIPADVDEIIQGADPPAADPTTTAAAEPEPAATEATTEATTAAAESEATEEPFISPLIVYSLLASLIMMAITVLIIMIVVCVAVCTAPPPCCPPKKKKQECQEEEDVCDTGC